MKIMVEVCGHPTLCNQDAEWGENDPCPQIMDYRVNMGWPCRLFSPDAGLEYDADGNCKKHPDCLAACKGGHA